MGDRAFWFRNFGCKLMLMILASSAYSDLSNAGLLSNFINKISRGENSCLSLAGDSPSGRSGDAKGDATDGINHNIQSFDTLPEANETRLILSSLGELRLMIEAEKVSGKGGLVLRALRDGYQAKETEVFNLMIENGQIQTRDQFDLLLKSAIASLQPQKVQDQEATSDARQDQQSQLDEINLDSERRQFHRLNGGRYVFRHEDWHKANTFIKSPFELMDSPLTQLHWAKLMVAMGETDPNLVAPSHFKDGDASDVVGIGELNIRIQPHHPVENVSYEQTVKFLTRLNEMSRLEDTKIQRLLEDLFNGHKRGDEYDIPTLHQIEFAMNLRGKITRSNHDSFKDENEKLLESAWHLPESNWKTHPVATRPPRMIDIDDKGTTREFYDLDGNVCTWIKGGFSPVDENGRRILPTSGSRVVYGFQGSSFKCQPNEVVNVNGHTFGQSPGSPEVGIRLVRKPLSSVTLSDRLIGKPKQQAEKWMREIKKKILARLGQY